MRVLPFIIALTTFLFQPFAFAGEYSLSIQPNMSKEDTLKSYQPLADYLSKQTGHTITIKTYRNYFTYWQKMKRSNNFDLVLDAAHFTDYRVQNKNYEILAKLPDTMSFSLVTHENAMVINVNDLVLKKVATQESPSLCGIRLYEIFNDPSKLPVQVTMNNSSMAIQAVKNGEVDAAIIPTSLVGKHKFLHTVVITEAIPQLAVSASDNVPFEVQQDIKRALMLAHHTQQGQSMLQSINVAEFINTGKEEYAGYASLLKDLFGYETTLTLVY